MNKTYDYSMLKASELIEKLQEAMKEYGDTYVYMAVPEPYDTDMVQEVGVEYKSDSFLFGTTDKVPLITLYSNAL